MLRRDGDSYFPEAFTSRYLKENYGMTFDREEQKGSGLVWKDKAFIQNCLNALKDLHRVVESQPTPYYALVRMDGDKMGTLMSSIESKCKHQNISNALSSFARKEVPRIVQEEHPGRLVYAGGDDVVALTPLHDMLDMVDKLRKQYSKQVGKEVGEEKVTASMGIAIAHHFTPLSVVRRAALDAEKLAKNHYGRNALVVTVLRRSGEQTRVGCHWYYPGLAEDGQPISLFSRFLTLFAEDVLSSKSVHILLEEASVLVGLDLCAQKSEVKRVLLRQISEGKKREKHKEETERLAGYLVDLAKAMDNEVNNQAPLEVELHANNRRYGLVETLGWLLVMAFLAREGLER